MKRIHLWIVPALFLAAGLSLGQDNAPPDFIRIESIEDAIADGRAVLEDSIEALKEERKLLVFKERALSGYQRSENLNYRGEGRKYLKNRLAEAKKDLKRVSRQEVQLHRQALQDTLKALQQQREASLRGPETPEAYEEREKLRSKMDEISRSFDRVDPAWHRTQIEALENMLALSPGELEDLLRQTRWELGAVTGKADSLRSELRDNPALEPRWKTGKRREAEEKFQAVWDPILSRPYTTEQRRSQIRVGRMFWESHLLNGHDKARHGHYQEALEHYELAFNEARRSIGTPSQELYLATDYLIQTFLQTGQEDKALKLYDWGWNLYLLYVEPWTEEKERIFVYNERNDLNCIRKEYANLLSKAGRGEEADSVETGAR